MGAVLLGVEQLKCVDDSSPLPSAKANVYGALPPLPLYVIMAQYLGTWITSTFYIHSVSEQEKQACIGSKSLTSDLCHYYVPNVEMYMTFPTF